MPGCKSVHPLREADKSVCASVSHRAECNNINITLSLWRGLSQVSGGEMGGGKEGGVVARGNFMNERTELFPHFNRS